MNCSAISLKLIRKEHPNVICIMLSGYLENELNTESEQIFRHIMKPYKKAQLKGILEEAFDKVEA